MNKMRTSIVNWLLAIFWSYFAYNSFNAFVHYHKISALVFCISETAAIIFFLIRSNPKKFPIRFSDYIIALLGTFLILLYRPTSTPDLLISQIIILIAASIQCFGLFSLNTSFGIFPANRGIKVHGAYMYIRHPLYLSYTVSSLAYFMSNATIFNAIIVFFSIFFQIWRIFREENLLSKDQEYQTYMEKVRYRLIPGIF